jgi:hypothetical protein
VSLYNDKDALGNNDTVSLYNDKDALGNNDTVSLYNDKDALRTTEKTTAEEATEVLTTEPLKTEVESTSASHGSKHDQLFIKYGSLCEQKLRLGSTNVDPTPTPDQEKVLSEVDHAIQKITEDDIKIAGSAIRGLLNGTRH